MVRQPAHYLLIRELFVRDTDPAAVGHTQLLWKTEAEQEEEEEEQEEEEEEEEEVVAVKNESEFFPQRQFF